MKRLIFAYLLACFMLGFAAVANARADELDKAARYGQWANEWWGSTPTHPLAGPLRFQWSTHTALGLIVRPTPGNRSGYSAAAADGGLVLLARDDWQWMTDPQRCVLVFHEVGHEHGYQHSADPRDVMSPTPPESFYPCTHRLALEAGQARKDRLELRRARGRANRAQVTR